MVRDVRLSSNHYELVIGGALFTFQKDCYKQTWTSPGGSAKHQLDNALFSKRWRSSLPGAEKTSMGKRCRSPNSPPYTVYSCFMHGADTDDFVSDHHLLMEKVRIKIPKLKKN